MKPGFPYIPEALLKTLDEVFPERAAANPNQNLSQLMWAGGERSVVRFLQARFKEQQAAQEPQNVLVQPQGS